MNRAIKQRKPTGRVSNSEPPGMRSKTPASTIVKTKNSVLQLNKPRASGCNSSSRKSQISQTPLSDITRHMKHTTESTTQRKERPAALDRTKTKKRVPQRMPYTSRSTSNVMPTKQRSLPPSDISRPKQDIKTPRMQHKNPPPSTTAASRRKSSIKRPVQLSKPRTKAGKVQTKQDENTTKPKQMSSSSLVRKNITRESSTGVKKQNTTAGFQKLSGPRSEEEKLMTPRLSIAVVVQPRSSPKDQPTEISLWKRIKTKSSVKIVSEWKTDEKLENHKHEMSDKLQKEDQLLLDRIEERSVSPESKSSNTCTVLIDQPSTAKSSIVVQDETVSMALPLSAKNNPLETLPLTSRSPVDSIEQREEEEDVKSAISIASSSHSEKVSSSTTPDLEDNESSVQFQTPEDVETEFQGSSVSSHPNPPNLTPMDSCFANASVKTDAQELDSAISRTPKCTYHISKFSAPGSIIYNPMARMSPELVPFNRPEKHTGSLSYGGLHLTHFSSFESNSDPYGMQSSRSPLRRVDSARIGAQCEFLRDTIKEESKRVMSMTSLLEAMNSSPGNLAGQNKTEIPQTLEINRRQAEKIHDLEMENQHLRQLLEFSIGSIRRQGLTPSHRSDEEQCFGPAFNNPIPVLEQADKELVNKTALKNKQTKPYRGQKSSVETEQIYELQQTLESKDVLLKVITESICQISSMHGYYQKRLEDLEKDRSRIQKARSEHLNELLRFGIDLRSQELDGHSQKPEVFRQMGDCESFMGFANDSDDC